MLPPKPLRFSFRWGHLALPAAAASSWYALQAPPLLRILPDPNDARNLLTAAGLLVLALGFALLLLREQRILSLVLTALALTPGGLVLGVTAALVAVEHSRNARSAPPTPAPALAQGPALQAAPPAPSAPSPALPAARRPIISSPCPGPDDGLLAPVVGDVRPPGR